MRMLLVHAGRRRASGERPRHTHPSPNRERETMWNSMLQAQSPPTRLSKPCRGAAPRPHTTNIKTVKPRKEDEDALRGYSPDSPVCTIPPASINHGYATARTYVATWAEPPMPRDEISQLANSVSSSGQVPIQSHTQLSCGQFIIAQFCTHQSSE